MKNLILCTVIASLIIWTGCSSDSKEDLEIDCNQSDLSVSVSGTTEPTCDTEGSITLTGSGGTTPYTYSLDGINFQSSAEFTGLVAGSLSITVKDANECTSTLNTTLNSDGAISLSITTTKSECLQATGSIEIIASDGDGNYTYTLDDGTGQASNTFSSVGSGDHVVKVTDGAGCVATKDVYVSSDVSLSGDIMPLLQAQCTFSGCHNGDNGSSRNWTEKEDVLAKAVNIKARTQSGDMPRSPGTLTQAQVTMIACWVDDGGLDN